MCVNETEEQCELWGYWKTGEHVKNLSWNVKNNGVVVTTTLKEYTLRNKQAGDEKQGQRGDLWVQLEKTYVTGQVERFTDETFKENSSTKNIFILTSQR